jgi:diguanylate cyclase (GGDEF)-like protein/putative nucleotidyltransferase with HDIG domain
VRLTTKTWLIISLIVLGVVLGGTAFSVQRQVDRRVKEARRFNAEVVYPGIRLFVDKFSLPYIEGRPAVFSVEDLNGFSRVAGIALVEIYLPGAGRIFTTDPSLTPSPAADAEAIQQALQGSTTSSIWIMGAGSEGGHRVNDLNLVRILRGGAFADEFWGPVQSPDGRTMAVTRALIGLPGLHHDAVAMVLTNGLMGGALVVGLWVALWLTLQALIRRPLARLTSTTRRIREGEISLRAPIVSHGDLGQLAASFNAMADELERQATTDPITGLLNHRYGDVALDEALEQARSRGSPLSVLIGDMDDFKLFNDTFGHPLGDEVLRLVAGVFRQMSGDSGIASRYGGDEFLVVLPGADRAAASAFADRLSAAIGEIEFQAKDGRRVPIGLSLGVASFPEDSESKDRLLVLADAAMYEAKRLGGIDRQEPCVVDAGGVGVESVFGALDSLVQAVQYRDHYTKTHSDLVAEYAAKLALRVGFSEEATRAIRIAGILHDVGKLIVPDDILKKPGPLTAEEREVIQRHPLVGETLIRETPFLEDVIQAVGCHHERYDGSGYPRGLCGDEIPLLGRALAIADAYSAMSLDRPYRKALSDDEIVAEFEAGAGTNFDPHLAKVFVEMLLAEGRARAA